ncbi:MAG: hypothetical protein N2746_00565, partial [Deltaproteobacteria bacterium]|nr:hypothetical protein [Deltaproteobacteria bacterium]
MKSKVGCIHFISLLTFMVPFVVSCETKEDGIEIDEDQLGFQKCENDFDCGRGRFCDEKKICSIECTTFKDCNTKYSLTGLGYECSPCGRCIVKGEEDTKCIITEDLRCQSNRDCTSYYKSENFSCHNNYCSPRCTTDSSCSKFGLGFSCNTHLGICYRSCHSDEECYIHGWHYECRLPRATTTISGAPMVGNHSINSDAIGECVPRIGGIEWGNEKNPKYAAHQYEGVWGFAINAAMTIKNVPFINIQHTVLKSLLLVKMVQK